MPDFSSVVHLLAAVVLMGHLLYRATVVASLSKPLVPSADDHLPRQLLRRTAWIGWASLAFLLATGLFLVSHWHIALPEIISGQLLLSRFGTLLALKLVGTALIITTFLWPSPSSVTLLRLPFLVGLMVILVSVLLVR